MIVERKQSDPSVTIPFEGQKEDDSQLANALFEPVLRSKVKYKITRGWDRMPIESSDRYGLAPLK